MDRLHNECYFSFFLFGGIDLFRDHFTTFGWSIRYRGTDGMHNLRSSGRGNDKTIENAISQIIKLKA